MVGRPRIPRHARPGTARRAFLSLALPAVALATPACRSTYTANHGAANPVLVTQGDVERPYRVIGHVSVHQTGWYLLALLPIVSIDMAELLEETLPKAAFKLGADAVLFARYEMKPASIFRFSVFPVPDWTAEAIATGMAVRFLDAGGGPPVGAQPPAVPRR